MSRLPALLVLGAAAAAIGFLPTLELGAFGAFTALLALALAAIVLLDDRPPERLVLQTGLVLLALATRHLAGIALGTQALALLASPSALAPAALTVLALALLGLSTGSLDLAAIGAAARPEALATSAGAVLLVLALLLTVVVVTRSALASPENSIAGGAFASAGILLAVGASLTRVLAWLPDLAPRLEAWLAVASGLALAYGAARLFFADRLRSLLVGLALAEGGLVGFALLGGVHGRTAVLLQLVTSTVAITFVALGLSRRGGTEALTVGELEGAAAPASARALVAVGGLAALALPPFPGAVARLATASSLLGRGELGAFLAELALSVGLVFGVVGLVAAGLAGSSAPRRRSFLVEALVYLLVAGFVLAVGLLPGPLYEAAQHAAAGLF